MSEGPIYGPRFESALVYANALHHGQSRKGGGAPYIVHPLAVASIVGQYGGDEDQAVAALLHDVVEDCGVGPQVLRERYGERVCEIVIACTDTDQQPKPPWRPRKEAHIARVKQQPGDVRLVIAADKLHNALSIARDRRLPDVGEQVWDRFSADREGVLWYYRAMCSALRDGWNHPLGAELSFAVARLEAPLGHREGR